MGGVIEKSLDLSLSFLMCGQHSLSQVARLLEA